MKKRNKRPARRRPLGENARTKLSKALDQKLRDGIAAKKSGDLDEAMACYTHALKGFRNLKNISREVLTLINIGTLETQRGKYSAAKDAFTQGLTLAEPLDDLDKIATCAGNIAAIHLELGELEAAEPLLERALVACEEGHHLLSMGNQLGNLGMLCKQRGEHDIARAHLERAADVFIQAKYPTGAAGVLRILAEIHRREGDAQACQDSFERALFLSRGTKDTTGEAFARQGLGQSHLAKGNLRRAATHFQAALNLHQETEDPRGQSSAHLDLGQSLCAQGEAKNGIGHLTEALNIARKIGSVDLLSSALSALGNQLNQRGDLKQGIQLLKEAEALHLRSENKHGLISTRLNLTLLRLQRGDWEGVEEDLQLLDSLTRAAHFYDFLPTITALRAQHSVLQGHITQAQELFIQAAREFKTIERQRPRSSALLSSFALRIRRLELHNLGDEILELITELAATHDHHTEADAWLVLAELRRTEGTFVKASKAHERAEKMLRSTQQRSALSTLLCSRAETTLRQHHWQEPLPEYAKDAIREDLSEAFNIATERQLLPRLSLCNLYLAEFHRRCGEHTQAQDALNKGTQLAENLSFPHAIALSAWTRGRALFPHAETLKAATDAWKEAFEIFTKMGALGSLKELQEDLNKTLDKT